MPATPTNSELAAEIVANHDERWTQEGTTVHLDDEFGGMTISTEIEGPHVRGSSTTIVLFLRIEGGPFVSPAWASISGYGEDPLRAIVDAACLWTCTFLPVLRAGVTGAFADPVSREEVTIDGTRYSLYADSIARGISSRDEDPSERLRATAIRFGVDGTRSMTSIISSTGSLPSISTVRPTLVSAFVADGASRTIEIKINGGDWLGSSHTFDHVPPGRPDAIDMLREVAVLVPVGSRFSAEALPSRVTIERTLDGIGARPPRAGASHGWQGWTAHGGRLGMPLDARALLPGVDLPSHYVDLLATVGAPGAGPGYGLLAPDLDGDRIALAHAGCGCTWYLRLDVGHAGEVWVDASGSDETYSRVALTATAWYTAWLDAIVRDGLPWIQWNSRACATANMLANLLESKRAETGEVPRDLAADFSPGAIKLTAWLPGAGQVAGDPCQGCVARTADFNLGPEVYAPGALLGHPTPHDTHQAPPPPPPLSTPVSETPDKTKPRRSRWRR